MGDPNVLTKHRKSVVLLKSFHLPQWRQLTIFQLYPRSFRVFTSCLLSPPRHFEEKKGGVFKTILLFVQFMAERASPWRGRVSYPCIEAILYTRRKYVSNGLITCAYRTSYQPMVSSYIQSSTWSTDLVLSPIQSLLTKRGHINLNDWMQEDWYSHGWYLLLFTCLCHTLVYCRLVCQQYVLGMCSTYPPFALIGHAPRDL